MLQFHEKLTNLINLCTTILASFAAVSNQLHLYELRKHKKTIPTLCKDGIEGNTVQLFLFWWLLICVIAVFLSFAIGNQYEGN